jgi:hypothetical protein
LPRLGVEAREARGVESQKKETFVASAAKGQIRRIFLGQSTTLKSDNRRAYKLGFSTPPPIDKPYTLVTS